MIEVRKMDWMSEEFFEATNEFLETQKAQLDPKSARQSEWLKEVALSMEVGFDVYQSWMTPAQYCWAVIQKWATESTKQLSLIRKDAKSTLILIKAQHPLTPEGKPGDEYCQRLDRAIEVAYSLGPGKDVCFMVVGGTHAGHKRTLASAGAGYLLMHYNGAYGSLERPAIYSGNDEDWTACDEFLNNPMFSELVIVGSTGQYMRSYMSCLLKGIVPRHELITFLGGHQNPIFELASPWSVGGFFAKGPMEVFRQADETARRHIEEAEGNNNS